MKKIVILCIAAVSFAGCTGKKGVTAVAEDKGVLTKSAVAEEASVQLTEVFTSEIEPYKENDITPAASGVHIDRIYVEVGDPVREGQLVVTLDPTQYTQQLVQLKTVEDDYNRLLPVYEAGGISAQQIEQAKAQLDVQREVGRQPQEEYRGPFAHYGRRHGPQLRVGRPVRRAAYPAYHADRSAEGRRQHFGAVFPQREGRHARRSEG